MLNEIAVVLGDLPVPQSQFLDFLKEHGQEWEPAPLPDEIDRGREKECFKNATLTAIAHKHLDYVEGIGFAANVGIGGMAFLHAWNVDQDGKVVDTTWERPEKCRYYGVKFPKAKFTKHIFKAKVYGIFGGLNKTARKVIEKGGL
jgi:hypothetical protein